VATQKRWRRSRRTSRSKHPRNGKNPLVIAAGYECTAGISIAGLYGRQKTPYRLQKTDLRELSLASARSTQPTHRDRTTRCTRAGNDAGRNRCGGKRPKQQDAGESVQMNQRGPVAVADREHQGIREHHSRPPAAERLRAIAPKKSWVSIFPLFTRKDDVSDGKCEQELEAAARDARFEHEGGRA